MQLNFKQAVLVDKKRYALGIHEVPEEAMKHPHFKKFMKAGYIVVAGKADVPAEERELKDLPVLAPSKLAAKKAQIDKEALEEAGPVSTIGEGKKVKGK